MQEDDGYLGTLAAAVGASGAAVRLLLSILAGYPVAFVYRKYFFLTSPLCQHLYFIATGLLIGAFNFGWDIIHAISAIAITYVILAVLGGSLLSLSLVFLYAMAHLLIGYWTTATSEYDIKWTMPQCVLTLRLIGLAFNYYDGQQSENSLSKENQSVALKNLPGWIEVFAHNLYPTTFLIGPQLPLARFRKFVTHTFHNENPLELPQSVRTGLLRCALGFMYLIIYLIGSSYFTDDTITRPDFWEYPLWKRLIFVGIWGRIALYKYICCWLLTEGACIVMGLTYNGKNEYGEVQWDGCSNVKISTFETTTKMEHYIDSFNINTNHWVAQYIYKRLKFLNNKVYSQFGVLLFLALWHGFHSGYYATFFFEFISILSEKTLQDVLLSNKNLTEYLNHRYVKSVLYILLRLHTFVCMGYAMNAFILLKHRKYLGVYASLYYSYHIIYILILLIAPFLRKKLKRS